ncbi:MAG: hypothetical protein N2Z20_05730 [Elusimicrobiales bacterium]|nr:hypothetical protein [Elusimicrobiales bacterium]
MAIYKLLISLEGDYNNNIYDSIYENIRKMGGVLSVQIFDMSGVMKIIYDDAAVKYEKIISRILSFDVKIKNYSIESDTSNQVDSIPYNLLNFNKLIWIFLVFVVFYYSDKFLTNKYISFPIYFFIILWLSYDFIKKHKSVNKTINIYSITLIYFFSFLLYKLIVVLFPSLFLVDFVSWYIIVFFILVIYIGFYLFNYFSIKNKTYSRTIKSFMPAFIKVKKESGFERINIEDIMENDVVIFEKGDFISSDSVIIFGKAIIDESLIKGSNNLVEKKEGDEIYAGSFVLEGKIEARIIKKPKFSNFFNILSYSSKFNKKESYFIHIPFIIFDKFLIIIPIIILLISIFSFKKYVNFSVIDSIFISIFILYPYVIWIIFPLLYIFSSSSGIKRGFYIKNIDSIIPVIYSNTIVFFYDKGIDFQSIDMLRKNGFETILISDSGKINEKSSKGLDVTYYSVPQIQKEGYIIKMKLAGKKMISIGRSVEDLVALLSSDVSIITMIHPESFSFNCDIILLKNEPKIIVELKNYCNFMLNIIKENSYLVILFHLFILPLIILINGIMGNIYYIQHIVFFLTIFMLIVIGINSARVYLSYRKR